MNIPPKNITMEQDLDDKMLEDIEEIEEEDEESDVNEETTIDFENTNKDGHLITLIASINSYKQ